MQQEKKIGAPRGNEFYKLVKSPGRKRKYSPSGLWKKAFEYFTWATENPLEEEKAFGNGNKVKVSKMRPFTEIAFCLYAGIDENTFRRYKNDIEYKDFWGVSETISKIIYSQKFDGAAADLLNPNIIARDLGLKDRQGLDIDVNNLSEDQVDKLYSRIEKMVTNELNSK